MTDVARADVCAVAIADCFRGDGEILANPIGTLPTLGGRLARELHEPRLVMTDGEACLIGDTPPLGEAPAVIAGWNPYRRMFDVVWGGRRHVMMGAAQIDRYGNQNIASIGADPDRPMRQLLGFRGAPGNTINNPTSYWIPRHSTRVFVEKVDVVCGIGYDRAAQVGAAARFHELRRVVTNLAVLDFETPDRRMRLRSVHPGVTVEEVQAATGFELAIDGEVPQTRLPTPEELAVLDRLDPEGLRHREVPS
ncbi:CoA-transferase subunit beta [Thermomonospora catenispora]|uniref:CoA-transferase subunit beta n=1 Tax=Thermomonospora catenispora TaxID=2493090 RepID=UPI001122E203|nr:CoA-transferase [Thermomonospora catenispora]TNY37981.1 CoA-transferase [Thermomonospora catenispora]